MNKQALTDRMPGAITRFPSVVGARLNYYKPSSGHIFRAGTAKEKLREWDVQDVKIRDIRCYNEDFTLDKNGFQLVEHESVEKAFDNAAEFQPIIYEETANLIKQITGASRVQPISHVRRRDTHQYAIEKAKKASADDVVEARGPAMFVHVDQSYDGAVQLLRDNVEDANSLMKTRWAVINVWRPVNLVTREPLAVCDSRSVAETDLHAVYSIQPRSSDSTSNVTKGSGFGLWYVAANPQHRWYYASNITPAEVLMIKCFDSKQDGRARRCPHTAFQSEEDYGPARQSLEIRCLVFWEEQECE